jgi:hypothetical protein
MSRLHHLTTKNALPSAATPVLVAGTLLFACTSPAFADSTGRAPDSSVDVEQVFGFGAITDDMIITRDLTVRTSDPPPVDTNSDDRLSQFASAAFNTTVNLLTDESSLPSSTAHLGAVTMEDDSYIITQGSNQTIESIAVCAAPALMAAFAAVPVKETGCGVLPVQAADHLDVPNGTALLVADRDMEIALNLGILKLSKGSVVLVSNTENGTAIFNFHDHGKGSVSLEVAGRAINIIPGRHLHATREKSNDFASVNALDRIAHRRVTSSAITNGVTIHSSEFSTLSALEAVGPLKKVMASSHPEARKLAQQVIKTSAVLMHLGSGSEDFKAYGRTRMTSLVNPN